MAVLPLVHNLILEGNKLFLNALQGAFKVLEFHLIL